MSGMMPRDLDEAFALAERLASSQLLPAHLEGRPHDIYTTILTGMELGLMPMAAIRGFFVGHDGELCLLADTMAAVALGSVHCEYLRCIESTAQRSTWETKRRGHHEPIRFTWTIDLQRAIGWAPGSMWDTDPISMLSARAKARLMRQVYPDLLAGFAAAEELPAAAPAPAPALSHQQVVSAVAHSAPTAAKATTPAETSASENEEIAMIRTSLRNAGDESAVKKLIASLASKSAAVRAEIADEASARLAQVRRDAKAAQEAKHE